MSQLEIEILITAAAVLAIYWFFVRPRIEKGGRKRDLDQLKVGDEVLTTSGFIGTVKDIYIPESGPVQIVIDFGNGVAMNALSSAIAQRVAAGQTLHSREVTSDASPEAVVGAQPAAPERDPVIDSPVRPAHPVLVTGNKEQGN